MIMSFTPVANTNAASPTGELGVVTGISNPIPYAVGPSQQINEGDIVCQYDDNAYGYIALPSIALPAANTGQQTGTTQIAQTQTAMAAIKAKYLGRSLSYRDPLNTSYGKGSDKIGIAVGRVKCKVNPNDYNIGNFLPAGTLVGPGVHTTGSVTTWTATALGDGMVNTTQSEAASTALNADYAIGRLAFDKQAGDTVVYVDEVSTVLSGGVQDIETS
jgi:hypothetical protein